MQHIESHIRDLKIELAQEELLTIQRELGLRDAAMERVIVAQGAPIIGHPIGDFDLPATTRIVAVFRGPFLLPLSDSITLRPDDIVILAGLRHDLDPLASSFSKGRCIQNGLSRSFRHRSENLLFCTRQTV